jgi:hypothetical protein
MNQPVSPQFGTGSWAASICFDIIRYSIIPIIRHEDLLAWVRYTRRLLVLCGKLREHVNDEVGAGSEAKPGAKSRVVITERAEKISKLGPSKSSLEETATTFKEILRQQEERRNGLEPTPQKFEAGLFYWVSLLHFPLSFSTSLHLLLLAFFKSPSYFFSPSIVSRSDRYLIPTPTASGGTTSD